MKIVVMGLVEVQERCKNIFQDLRRKALGDDVVEIDFVESVEDFSGHLILVVVQGFAGSGRKKVTEAIEVVLNKYNVLGSRIEIVFAGKKQRRSLTDILGEFQSRLRLSASQSS